MLSKHKIFFDINSKDRVSGTDGNFTYHLEIPKDRVYDHVCLLGATIPKSYYLVPEGGNTFDLQEIFMDSEQNAQVLRVTISLPVGNCNRRSFAIAVESLLNQHSPAQAKYKVSYPGPNEFDDGKFTFSRITALLGSSTLFMPESKNSRLYEQFGFDAGESVFVHHSEPVKSRNVTKFVNHDMIFVRSDICQNGTSNVLHGINAVSTAPFSDITHHCPEMAAYSKALTSSRNSTYQFSITDEEGNVLDFNGLPVNLRLIVYQSDNTNELVKQAIGLYNAQSQD